jgi:hypothetical protein
LKGEFEMNWKKALLVIVVLGFAFVLLVAATIGLAVTSAVVAVVDSGVVQPVVEAIDEVTEGASRLQIELDEETITFTNPDNGRSRVIVPGARVRDGYFELDGPEITIVDPENGETRVIVPDLPRVPRVIVNGEDHHLYWTANPLAPIGFFFRGVFTLTAVALIVVGAYLLLRARRQDQSADKAKSV